MRRSVYLFLVLVMMLSMVTLGYAAPKSIVFKFAHDNSPDSFTSSQQAFAQVFKTIVEDKSNGAIKVQIYPAGALGKVRERIEMIQSNIIQGTLSSIGGITQFIPEIGALDIPFAIRDYEVAHRVFDGPFLGELRKALWRKMSVRLLSIAEVGGFYVITNNVRPIRKPQDMKGLKIRTMEVPVQMKMFEALGANATPIAFSEVYTSLQTGVISGQTNPVPIVVDARFYEVQKYLTLTNHLYGTDWFLVSDKFLKGLSAEQQTIIYNAARSATIASRGLLRIIESTNKGTGFLKKHGMRIYSPTPGEIAKFKKIAVPAVKKFIAKKYGSAGKTWANKYLKAIDAVQAKLAKETITVLK
jgi:tripartite ATP-independent transporter DctP family solute receptor